MNKKQRNAIVRSTPEQFVEWLGGFDAAQTVGDAYEGSGCALSAFIEHAAGVEVFVGTDEICHDGAESGHPTKTVPTPDWMASFIIAMHDAADEKAGVVNRAGRPYPCPVRADAVFAVLANLHLVDPGGVASTDRQLIRP
jgi:hypothetical protein